jgi:N-acetylneuraminate synthase
MLIDHNFEPYAVSRNVSVQTALRKVYIEKRRFLMCMNEDGRIWGILTYGDLLQWLISETNPSMEQAVGDICNRKAFTVKEGKEEISIKPEYFKKFAYIPIVDANMRPVAIAMRRELSDGFYIGERFISEKSPCYIIAEIGNNHNGSLDLAKKLIEQAKAAGADCAKFQMRDMASLYVNAGNADSNNAENLGSQYTLDLLSRFQLSTDELFAAFDYCRSGGIEPLCTPWDANSAALLHEYGMPAYKVASADLTNHELLQLLVKFGKPLLCSTGMSLEREIIQSVGVLKKYGAQYVLLHCNSTYPAPFKDVRLNYLPRLRELGDCLVGYSGHERDVFVPVAAVAYGAKVVEKHFTLDRRMEGNDHKVSLLPEEFARMAEGIRQVEEAMALSGERELSQGEMINRATLAKSVCAACNIAVGTRIEREMLEVKSPGQGLQPNRLQELLGRMALRPMKTGDFFWPADLEDTTQKPRLYRFHSRWGLPVRHHDHQRLSVLSNPDLLEFHLSYKDLALEHDSFFPNPVRTMLVVHAPELFAGDHILDLTSPDKAYRARSVSEMRRVIAVTKALRWHFDSPQTSVGVITNVGGFSPNAPLSVKERLLRKDFLLQSLQTLWDKEVTIWPQTMPPFPWHFGGQRYHNLFLDPGEITDFCRKHAMHVCLDVSHTKLACNYLHCSFQHALEQLLPVTAHMHIADACGLDGEGLQIGEGDIDFYAVGKAMRRFAPEVTWIPEIWQGHENDGAGFWQALAALEENNF